MPLPQFEGSVHIRPKADCDATVQIGDMLTAVSGQTVTVRAGSILAVKSGNFAADLQFEADLVF